VLIDMIDSRQQTTLKKLFFGEWRLANGEQILANDTLIWQISHHLIWAKFEAECW